MSVKISGVERHSPAWRKGIRPGMTLLTVNGNEIQDVLDYRFYITEPQLILEILCEDGKQKLFYLRKNQYDDIGLEFDTYLMDRQRRCQNNCIFCFIDQTPKGMRESLYFKDDDARLSFLFGNYITLNNITQGEIDRIIKMHISPVNVSVHTTNPTLRAMMMGNRFAGEKLEYLYCLARAGIKMNTQLVLCPGINDGKELERSLLDLSKLYPSVQSIALVPVGLTDHREGLYPLRGFTQKEAAAVIDLTDSLSALFMQQNGCRIAYPADEFFLKAGRPLPQTDYYGDFQQLENGVGMLSLLREEFNAALHEIEPSFQSRHVTVATGVAARDFLNKLVDFLKEKWHNLICNVIAIENHFYGSQITVSGLVTGRDLIEQLKGRELGEELLIPCAMLRHEQDRFLDDVTLEQAQEALQCPICPVPNDGYELVDRILGQ